MQSLRLAALAGALLLAACGVDRKGLGEPDGGVATDLGVHDTSVPDMPAPPIDMSVDVPTPPTDTGVDMPPPIDTGLDMPPPVDTGVDMPAPVDMGVDMPPADAGCTVNGCATGNTCQPDGTCAPTPDMGPPCGADGEMCCPGTFGPTCNMGFGCNSGTCLTCDADGRACCPSFTGGDCVGATLACVGFNGTCHHCGDMSEVCCAGFNCNGSLSCHFDGTCR